MHCVTIFLTALDTEFRFQSYNSPHVSTIIQTFVWSIIIFGMILTLALVTDFVSITRVKGHNSSMMRRQGTIQRHGGSPYLVVDLSDRPQRRICPCSVISLKGMPLRLCIIRRRDLPQGYALEVFGTSFSLRYALERGDC